MKIKKSKLKQIIKETYNQLNESWTLDPIDTTILEIKRDMANSSKEIKFLNDIKKISDPLIKKYKSFSPEIEIGRPRDFGGKLRGGRYDIFRYC